MIIKEENKGLVVLGILIIILFLVHFFVSLPPNITDRCDMDVVFRTPEEGHKCFNKQLENEKRNSVH